MKYYSSWFLIRYYHIKYRIKSRFASFLLKIASILHNIAYIIGRIENSILKLGRKFMDKSSEISINAFDMSNREYDEFIKKMDLDVNKHKILEDTIEDLEDILDIVDANKTLDELLHLPPTIDKDESPLTMGNCRIT